MNAAADRMTHLPRLLRRNLVFVGYGAARHIRDSPEAFIRIWTDAGTCRQGTGLGMCAVDYSFKPPRLLLAIGAYVDTGGKHISYWETKAIQLAIRAVTTCQQANPDDSLSDFAEALFPSQGAQILGPTHVEAIAALIRPWAVDKDIEF